MISCLFRAKTATPEFYKNVLIDKNVNPFSKETTFLSQIEHWLVVLLNCWTFTFDDVLLTSRSPSQSSRQIWGELHFPGQTCSPVVTTWHR